MGEELSVKQLILLISIHNLCFFEGHSTEKELKEIKSLEDRGLIDKKSSYEPLTLSHKGSKLLKEIKELSKKY